MMAAAALSPHKASPARVPTRCVAALCAACFLLGVCVVNRYWAVPEHPGCPDKASSAHSRSALSQVSQSREVIMVLDKTISDSEMRLAAARASQAMSQGTSPGDSEADQGTARHRMSFVMGVFTTFANRKVTSCKGWKRRALLSVSLLDAGITRSILARHRAKPQVYIGCMKSGPVIAKNDSKYYEPDHWKFGTEGNNYFRHATRQLYAVTRDLATYISANRHILHKYSNEDVSFGSWLIGLEVEHVDERSLCCGTPPVGVSIYTQTSMILRHLLL